MGTRNPARLAAGAIAAALLAAPGIAEAKAGCELIAVLRAEGDARLKGVGVAVNGRGTVDATLDGKPALLRDAAGCDLESPQDGFGLECAWDYGPGEDEAAQTDFERLLGRVNACLPTPLAGVAPVVYSESEIKELGAENGASFANYLRAHKDLGRFMGSYPAGRDPYTSLRIDLSFYRDDRNGTLRVSADFSRY